MKETLQVKVRQDLGSKKSRNLRAQGLIPAVLYGHKQASVSLTLTRDQVSAAIRHGTRLVDLQGDVQDIALIRQVQWDAFGIEVLHVDLGRVSPDESVDLVLPIELRGVAPGTREGGIVEHVKHEARISCPVVAIPEKLYLNISGLHVGQELLLSNVTLPEGAKLLGDPDEIVVHCVTPKDGDETPAAEGGPAEPEVIGRKKGDEEGAEEE